MPKRIFSDTLVSGAASIKAVKIDGMSITTKPVQHLFRHVISASDTLTVSDDGLLTHVINRTGSSVTLTIDGMTTTIAAGFSLHSLPLSPGMEITSSGIITFYVEPLIISYE